MKEMNCLEEFVEYFINLNPWLIMKGYIKSPIQPIKVAPTKAGQKMNSMESFIHYFINSNQWLIMKEIIQPLEQQDKIIKAACTQ